MSEELKPESCPMCGGLEFSMHEGTTFRWRVLVCGECGLQSGEARIDTLCDDRSAAEANVLKQLITDWNNRPKEQQQAARIAELEQKLNAIRALVVATGLTEDEGSTTGMVASICDLATARCKEAKQQAESHAAEVERLSGEIRELTNANRRLVAKSATTEAAAKELEIIANTEKAQGFHWFTKYGELQAAAKEMAAALEFYGPEGDFDLGDYELKCVEDAGDKAREALATFNALQ